MRREELATLFNYVAEESARLARLEMFATFFAALRGNDTRLTWENEINRYQTELSILYSDWLDDLVIDIATYPHVETEIIESSLERLQDDMILLGNQRIFETYDLGFGAGAVAYTEPVLSDVSEIMMSNEMYVTTSLIPDLRTRIYDTLKDEQYVLIGIGYLIGRLKAMGARVASYAGAAWNAVNRGAGYYARANNAPVYWVRDGHADHCETCLEFGNRVYTTYDALLAETGGVTPANGTVCRGNCRCTLLAHDGEDWTRP